MHQITCDVRSEIIRVRVTPDQKEQFAAYSASIGMRSATAAYKLAMNAMSAHVRPRPSGAQGAIRRPLRPSRTRMCPGKGGAGNCHRVLQV